MKTKSIYTLQSIEMEIIRIIKKYKLDHILAALHQVSEENRYEPFVIAGITLFAVNNCSPGKRTEYIQKI